jgi:putative tryptophan/tyrosine transport system substrate-binding protein
LGYWHTTTAAPLLARQINIPPARTAGAKGQHGAGALLLLWVITHLVLILGVTPSPLAASPAERSVLVLISQDTPLYRGVFQAMEAEITRAAPGRIRLSTRYLDGTAVSARVPAPELVVAIGTLAMHAAAERYPHTPAVVLFVPKARYEQLYADAFEVGNPGTRLTPGVVVLDQPIIRQVELARRLAPDGKIGLVLGPDTRHFESYLDEFQPELASHLLTAYASQADDVASAAQHIIAAVEVLLATPDSQVWSPEGARWLLHLAYQKRKPVVGFSAALTRAGAAVSVFSDPAHIGRQGGEKVIQWLNDDPVWRSASSPKYFRYDVNRNIASLLGIDADSLLASLEESSP